MAENPALRFLQILHLIPPFGRSVTVAELCRRLAEHGFEVSKRTVQRDLDSLAAVFPLAGDGNYPRRWSWAKDARRCDLPGLDVATALAFMQVEAHLQRLLPAAIVRELAPWFEQARCLLDGESLGDWARRVRVLDPGQPLAAPRIDSAVLAAVSAALLGAHALRLRYASRSRGACSEIEFHPLALVWHGPVAYLVGLYWNYDDPRHLALHRIRSAEVLQETPARVLPDFDLDAWLAEHMFDMPLGPDVVLSAEISIDVAQHLEERPLSAEQTLAPLTAQRYALRARVADTLQLRWWLLGFGDRVTVLEPASLRAELAETVARMAQAYGVAIPTAAAS